jgi:hypothetical protein
MTPRSGFLHQRTDQVVSADEHLQFLANHRGSFAAQLLHPHSGFNVSKEQLKGRRTFDNTNRRDRPRCKSRDPLVY